MTFGGSSHPDPDDFFSDTRMSFGDHLEDLRSHLWRAVTGFGVALIFGLLIGQPVMRFLCLPVEEELQEYWARYYQKKNNKIKEELLAGTLDQGEPLPVKISVSKSEMMKVLGNLGIKDLAQSERAIGEQGIVVSAQITNPIEMLSTAKLAEKIVGKKPSLATLNAQEGFLGYFKVSMVAAFVLASPWIFYQLWSFIAAGLYPHEKRYVNVFLPISMGLFLIGCVLCQFFVIPKAIGALLWFNEWLELEPDFRWNEWLGFAIFMPVVFGLAFQTPLVMLFLERIGILTVESYRAKRRIAWFAMTVIGALLLPSTDVQSLLMLCVPMCMLYELGILVCVFLPKPPAFDADASETDELIEV